MDLKKIILYNPAISSLNMGDHIIADASKEHLQFLLKDSFTVEVSTHLPISRIYMRHTKDFDYRFVCGSNLLRGKMDRLFRQWDIRLDQVDLVGESILLGTGWWQYGDAPDSYTKLLYKKVLSKNALHSVRDNYTKQQLESIGIKNVITTACPTMWKLTQDHCLQIDTRKKRNVVFTLTDYNKDPEADLKLISILIRNYNNVYYWIQGTEDYRYIKELVPELSGLHMIAPTLEAYDYILENEEVDYIGTRLHGGVRALQKGRRTIIIGVDNRAEEKKKDFNMTVISRDNIEEVEELIHKRLTMDIIIPEKEIKEWKYQFKQGI